MDIKTIIEISFFLITVATILWNFAYTQGGDKKIEESLNMKIDSHIRDNEKDMTSFKQLLSAQWKRIDSRKEWEEKHEKEAWENRNTFELKLAALHGADEKLQTMFISIQNKIDEKFLEQKIAIEKIYARLEK